MHKVVLWVQTVLVPLLGPGGVFVIAFCDSSFLSLPEINDILVVSAAAANPATAWVHILMATLGSLAGCSVLWLIGRRGGEPLLRKKFGEERIVRTRAAFARWDLLALAVPAVLPPPMPFKIFVLSAGVFGISYRRFAIALILARGFRYLTWGAMGVAYGDVAVELLRAMDAWFAERGFAILLALAGAAAAVLLVRVLLRRRTDAPAGL